MSERETALQAPLAVAFHRWGDMCCPHLEFSCFLSIKWAQPEKVRKQLRMSAFWCDPLISSVLLGGTETGVIVAYTIRSTEAKLVGVAPTCLICAHPCKVVSMIECVQRLYTPCAATMSSDGTLSVISLESMTVILNKRELFSENSTMLAASRSSSRIMFALQEHGMIECADIEAGTLLMRIRGLSSVGCCLSSHGAWHSVTGADGALAVFNMTCVDDELPACLYAIKIDERNVSSVVSPDLAHLLVVQADKWILYDSSEPLLERKCAENDFFVDAKWVSDTRFFVHTIGGCVQVWDVEKTGMCIFDFLKCIPSQFCVSNAKRDLNIITSMNVHDAMPVPADVRKQPKLVRFNQSSTNGLRSPVTVTVEGYIVTTQRPSAIWVDGPKRHWCDLSSCFNGTRRATCIVGDPVKHEAYVSVNGDICVDGCTEPLGVHKGAFRIFPVPKTNGSFCTFSTDGSIVQWSMCGNGHVVKAEFFDLLEPVCDVVWIEERGWIACIGKLSSFSVIDPAAGRSVVVCSGHNSAIVSLTYSEGLFHARCKSSSVYSWSTDGRLVTKMGTLKMKRKIIGVEKAFSESNRSQSEPVLTKAPVDENPFSRLVPLIMPHCQTFAVVFDLDTFLRTYPGHCDALDFDDDLFTPLKLLWHCHLGEGKSAICDRLGPLASLNFAVAGANFTVTLPITLKSTGAFCWLRRTARSHGLMRSVVDKPRQNRQLCKIHTTHAHTKKKIMGVNDAFRLSGMITAIHSIAASTIAQFFVCSDSDDLQILFGLSHVVVTVQLVHSIPPFLPVLAGWLQIGNENLNRVVASLLDHMINTMSETTSWALFREVHGCFASWSVSLTLALIIAGRFDIPPDIGRQVADNVLPAILQSHTAIKLLPASFHRLVNFLPAGNGSILFNKMLKGLAYGGTNLDDIVTVAWLEPLVFLEEVLMMQQPMPVLMKMFSRHGHPDRFMFYELLSRLVVRNQQTGDIGDIFRKIDIETSYFADNRTFVVFGTDDGQVMVISKITGGVICQERMSSNAITFISIAPDAKCMAIISAADRQATWVAIEDGESFTVTGHQSLTSCTLPIRGEWTGNTKLRIFGNDKMIGEFVVRGWRLFSR